MYLIARHKDYKALSIEIYTQGKLHEIVKAKG